MSRSRIIPGIEIAERMTCRILNAITSRNVHDRPGAGEMASVHGLFLRISRLPKQAIFASRSAARPSMKRRRCSGLSRSSAFGSFPPVATLSLSVSGRGSFKSCCALRAPPILVRLARWRKLSRSGIAPPYSNSVRLSRRAKLNAVKRTCLFNIALRAAPIRWGVQFGDSRALLQMRHRERNGGMKFGQEADQVLKRDRHPLASCATNT
jgi:hypothetical protein